MDPDGTYPTMTTMRREARTTQRAQRARCRPNVAVLHEAHAVDLWLVASSIILLLKQLLKWGNEPSTPHGFGKHGHNGAHDGTWAQAHHGQLHKVNQIFIDVHHCSIWFNQSLPSESFFKSLGTLGSPDPLQALLFYFQKPLTFFVRLQRQRYRNTRPKWGKPEEAPHVPEAIRRKNSEMPAANVTIHHMK